MTTRNREEIHVLERQVREIQLECDSLLAQKGSLQENVNRLSGVRGIRLAWCLTFFDG